MSWHLNAEAGTLSFSAVHVDGASVHLYKCFHQSEANARSCMVDIYLVEAFEYVLYVVGRHAYSSICHLQAHPTDIFLIEKFETDVDASVFGSKLEGVGQEIVQDTFYFSASAVMTLSSLSLPSGSGVSMLKRICFR